MHETATAKGIGFPSTHWSSVLAAGDTESQQGLEALGALLRRYEPALTWYLRQKFWVDGDEANDILQSFIAEVVLAKELIRKARPEKGFQFRKFLLTAFHNFAASHVRRTKAQKRCPSGGFVSLDESPDREMGYVAEPSPELFDVAWARGVIGEAMRLMKAECDGSGRPDVWGMFESRLVRPILEGIEPVAYDELVQRYGLQSPVQAQNLLVTAKRMFSRCLCTAVAQYATSEQDIESELRELQIILAHATS